jgi:hypothetical protein
MTVFAACQRQIVSMRRGGSHCRDPALVPIATAGDRAGMFLTAQGAPNADSVLSADGRSAVAELHRMISSGVVFRRLTWPMSLAPPQPVQVGVGRQGGD